MRIHSQKPEGPLQVRQLPVRDRKTSKRPRLRWTMWGFPFLLLAAGAPVLAAAKRTCGEKDIQVPRPPQMIEVDLALVRGNPEEGALPEWSRVEKLRHFYCTHAAQQAPCMIVEGKEIALQLFVSRSSIEAEEGARTPDLFTAEKAFQFYGASRLKVERADKEVTRVYAFPVSGPAKVGEVADEERLPVLLEDLAQLQMVRVPRFQRRTAAGAQSGSPSAECYLISNVTLVPSRVFDQSPPPVSDPAHIQLSLNGRRWALENVAREARWLQRIDTEGPGCRTREGSGYSAGQVHSLNLTVRELIPSVDFMTEELRAEDEGWKKAIAQDRPEER